jgi:hypothetical protein
MNEYDGVALKYEFTRTNMVTSQKLQFSLYELVYIVMNSFIWMSLTESH